MRLRVAYPTAPTLGDHFWSFVRFVFKLLGRFLFALFVAALGEAYIWGPGIVSFFVFLTCLVLVFSPTLFRLYQRFAPQPLPEIVLEEPEPPPEGSIHLGKILTDEGGALHLAPATLDRHLYLIGKTRCGKTTLLKRIALQHMTFGHGLCFIDPHGDACEDLTGMVPPDRLDDVILFDPTLPESPAFNLFALNFPPPKLTEDIISAMRQLFGSSWGPRMEHMLRFAVLTLLSDTERHSLADLRTLFLVPDYRDEVIRRITNETIRQFWEFEFPTLPAAASQPIINKLSALLIPTSDMERIFSAHENGLNFTRIMDERKILLVNLSKGLLGDEGSRLLGALISTGIQQAALARASMPVEERVPFSLIVDEFQNYATDSFSVVLSEAAKYKLSLTVAHQTLGQLDSSLVYAIFGNVGTMVSFQISSDDATHMRKEMHRSRIQVREKRTNRLLPLREFTDVQRDIYRAALTDSKWAGLPVDERHRAGKLSPVEQAYQVAQRHAEIARTLKTLEEDIVDAKLLRELFPNFEFREFSFPNIDDFINLKPHFAFCRVERAENVFPFKGEFPPDPDPLVRSHILERMKETHHQQREEQRPTPQVPPPKENSPLEEGEKRDDGTASPEQASETVQKPKDKYWW